jgi:hypothetical protein
VVLEKLFFRSLNTFKSEFNVKSNGTSPGFLSLTVAEIIAKNWKVPGENRIFWCLLEHGFWGDDRGILKIHLNQIVTNSFAHVAVFLKLNLGKK